MLDLNQPIRLVSLWQPWASLIAVGAKHFETRGNRTHYRGQLIIQAAKTDQGWEQYAHLWEENPIVQQFKEDRPAIYEAIHPATCRMRAVCITSLTGCLQITDFDSEMSVDITSVSDAEKLLGNWRVGRYAWPIGQATPLPRPLPYRGHQGGPRDADPGLAIAINAQLSALAA